MNIKINNLIKMILIFSLLSFTFALYNLNGAMLGYKLSIYDNLPLLSFYILLILNFLGFFIVIYCCRKKYDLWIMGLCLILLTNFIILILPYLMGYAYSSYGDHLTHIGYIKDILNTGHIDSAFQGNIYPITHILGSNLYFFSGVSVDTIAMFLGPSFYFLFVFSTYIFARKMYPGSEVYAILVSTLLFCFFYKEIYVMGFAYLTIPIIFYIYLNYYEKKSVNYAILLIIYFTLMPFLHPVVALILVAILGLFIIVNNLINVYIDYKSDFKSKYKISSSLLLFALVIVITWLMQTTWLWNTSVLNVVGWLNMEMLSTPLVDSASANFSKVGINFLEIIELFIKLYGSILLFALLSIIVAFKTLLKNDLSSKKNRFFILISYVMIFSIILWLIDVITPVTVLESGRMEWLLIVLMPTFVGIFFKSFFQDISKKIHIKGEMKFILIALIFGISSLLTILALYQSPFTYQFNYAISNSEISGANWIINYSDDNLKIVGAGIARPSRYQNALKGTLKTNYYSWDSIVNEHFNYGNFSELGESYNRDKYMLLRKDFLIAIYSGIYKNIGKFNEDDFSRLNNDTSTFKIYENGEMQNWYIKSSLITKK